MVLENLSPVRILNLTPLENSNYMASKELNFSKGIENIIID